MFIGAPVPQIVDLHFGQAFLLGPLENALAEPTVQQTGYGAENVDVHGEVVREGVCFWLNGRSHFGTEQGPSGRTFNSSMPTHKGPSTLYGIGAIV